MAERTKKDQAEREAQDVAGAVISQCEHCEHLWKVGKQNGSKWFCQAYPYITPGIPNRILAIGAGQVSPHGEKVKGQNGDYVYQPRTYETESGILYKVQADWSIKVTE